MSEQIPEPVQLVPQTVSDFKTRERVMITLRDVHRVGNPWVGRPALEQFNGAKEIVGFFECVGPAANECTVLIPDVKNPEGSKHRILVNYEDIRKAPEVEA